MSTSQQMNGSSNSMLNPLALEMLDEGMRDDDLATESSSSVPKPNQVQCLVRPDTHSATALSR